MYTQKEIIELLNKVEDAIKELKTATSQAHAARKDLLKAVKESKQEITETIHVEVAKQLEELVSEARLQMFTGVENAINDLAQDWRRKLGLPT